MLKSPIRAAIRGPRRLSNGSGLSLLLFVLTLASGAAAATFTASLDKDTITLGESATLSLTFSGANPQEVPQPPAIPNLQVAYVGPSSQFSFINGQVSSTVTHNFHLVPRQAGDFTIPALTAEVGGEKLTTKPLQLKVVQPGAPPPQAVNSGSQLAFMKLALPKTNLYLGETVVAQLQLYVNSRVPNIRNFELTSFPADGLIAGKILEGQHSQTQIGNAVYQVIPLNFSLRAIKSGALTLGPLAATMVLGRGDPFFEQFGVRDPFGQAKQVTLGADAEPIQVLPLPGENVPAGFNGAVGNFTLNVTAGPTNVAAGDPITVKVQISGRGTLDTVTLPEQTAWHDFKAYPPTSKVETDNLGIQGAKTFEQVLTPQTSDIKELPAFTFSFFDPDQKAYRTLSQPAIKLVVRPGGVTPMPTVTAPRPAENPPPSQDIVPIKQRPGMVAQIGPPLIQEPWFVALQGVPVLAFVSLLAWRKRTDQLANNPRLRRQRRVAQLVRDGLAELQRHAAANKSEEFFATLSRLLQEQLGERLDMPASAITEAVLEENLRPRGVPAAMLEPLQELFQTCNLARYAPIKSSQELAALIPKVETVLRSLQEVQL